MWKSTKYGLWGRRRENLQGGFVRSLHDSPQDLIHDGLARGLVSYPVRFMLKVLFILLLIINFIMILYKVLFCYVNP